MNLHRNFYENEMEITHAVASTDDMIVVEVAVKNRNMRYKNQ